MSGTVPCLQSHLHSPQVITREEEEPFKFFTTQEGKKGVSSVLKLFINTAVGGVNSKASLVFLCSSVLTIGSPRKKVQYRICGKVVGCRSGRQSLRDANHVLCGSDYNIRVDFWLIFYQFSTF